eukprot:7422494-Alexandrium_andersonii.AAC.1
MSPEELQASSAELAEMVGHHIGVPSGLGKKRSDLAHKIHAIVHALHLETGTEHLLAFRQT